MATLSSAEASPRPLSDNPPASPAFEWTTVTLGAWLMVGVYLDGWAHQHFVVETFFTPWHGVLYSGMLATGTFFVLSGVAHTLRGRPWRRSLPVGYGLSLV